MRSTTGNKQLAGKGKSGSHSTPPPTTVVISDSTVIHFRAVKDQHNEQKKGNNKEKTKEMNNKDQIKDKNKDKNKEQESSIDQHNEKVAGGVPGFVLMSPGAMSWSVDTSARVRAKASPTASWTAKANIGSNGTMVVTITMPSPATTTLPVHTTTTTTTTAPSSSHPAATSIAASTATTTATTATNSLDGTTTSSDGDTRVRRNVVLLVSGGSCHLFYIIDSYCVKLLGIYCPTLNTKP